MLQESGVSASSTGTTAALTAELMKKDSWDRYTPTEMRDDILDFCRNDFEFETPTD
jgi:hypothetical protein